MASRKAVLDGVVRQISSKLFFQNLVCFLLLDLILWLFAGPNEGTWNLLLVMEFLILGWFLHRNAKMLRSLLDPLEAMGETADLLNRGSLRPGEVEYLIRRLDKINVGQLGRRLPKGSQEMAGLTQAINAMLERIDRSYQAQARFVSDVSHELRTPISVIQGYASLLDRWGKDDPETRQEAIDAIVQESDSMSQLVEQLLFLARGDNNTQAVHLGPVDLAEVAEEVCRETQMVAADRRVTASLDALVLVNADERLVKQAYRVLVDNGVKYTAPGGHIALSLRRGDGYARLAVTDDGPGIARADLGKIFQRFYRTEQSRNRQTGGTGLGLSIADWIANRHGGWIEVTSRPGVGSRFTLVLPLLREESAGEGWSE